jgi:hypothetical protein
MLEANKLTADAQNENILLKDEVKKLKKKMKDEEDARCEAAIAADEKEGVLRESITNLLSKFLRACHFSNITLRITYPFFCRCCRYDHQSGPQAAGRFHV